MMPVRRARKPIVPELDACLEGWRRPFSHESSTQPWKRFRASPCGRAWFATLANAYPPARCFYCDHAPGVTIDHADARDRVDLRLSWKNWRLACGDCNRGKSTHKVVDPLRQDPREFFVCDIVSGELDAAPGASRARRKKAELTWTKLGLSHAVLNDARRERVRAFLCALADVVTGGGAASHIRAVHAELGAARSHRGILRDLILEEDGALNPHWNLVRAARALLPELEAWARDPVAHEPPMRPHSLSRSRAARIRSPRNARP